MMTLMLIVALAALCYTIADGRNECYLVDVKEEEEEEV